MVNSGEVNGIPVHASKWILTDLLRGELAFDGVVVTDWEDIVRLHTVHLVADSQKEAVRLAIEAGIDMSMVPYNFEFADHLAELVEDGVISETRIDESVRRILRLKYDLGLFLEPVPGSELVDLVGSETSIAVSKRAAAEAVTLVKNRGDVLPLDRSPRILVTGYGAASLSAFHGGWTYTWQGVDENAYPNDMKTLVDVLVDTLGIEQVTYVPGTAFSEEVSISAAVEEAFRADVVVVAIAEEASTEKPGDIEQLELPDVQRRLVEAIKATGTPVVVVLASNRPRIVREIESHSDAFLLAYQTGPYGPHAVADILLGNVNPSGRLPFTYPKFSGSIVPYDHKNSERADIHFGWDAFQPQWPFGFGLSYTTFVYSDLILTSDTLTAKESIDFSVTVTNTGEVVGKEVVQVYVRDLYASVTPSVKRLREFRKVELAPGDSAALSFSLPVSDLSFFGTENQAVLEPGTFELQVGDLIERFELE
jgi:beta-glucosidase